MRFFGDCEKILTEVGGNVTVPCQVQALMTGSVMQSLSLDATASHEPVDSLNEISHLLDMTDTGVQSPWSAVSTQTLKRSRDTHDVKQYWKRSYGYTVTSPSGCSLFQDALQLWTQELSRSKDFSSHFPLARHKPFFHCSPGEPGDREPDSL